MGDSDVPTGPDLARSTEAKETFTVEFQQELSRLIRNRRDVRHFRPDPVPAAVLIDLLEVSNLAPSVGLSQPWRFVIVSDAHRRESVGKIFEAENALQLIKQSSDKREDYARLKLAGLRDAPVHLALFVEPNPSQGHGLGRSSMPETIAYSGVMAVHTLWLAARALGIGLGWVSILQPAEVSAALDVPIEWSFIGYFCIGYPVTETERPELEQAGWEHPRPPLILQR